ncbi:MAG: FAD-dependent oxidoreductase [Lachnospiraceae bacterium]|nr:FAD-dependent oxidoreductase [Lachnospiraceae bacterium]
MIRIQQLKLKPDHSGADLEREIKRILHLSKEDPFTYEIMRQSIDARKKPDIYYVYTVDVTCGDEKKRIKNNRKNNVSLAEPKRYQFPKCGQEKLTLPPVIVGTGPAGLFCGLMLARAGFRPILLERGEAVEERQKTVEEFWKSGRLNPNSNVQFGEGGAGTFSDGKLTTMVKDPEGRIRFVMKNFVEAGADPEILYSSKPHIGTDVLTGVVKHIREEIQSLGGRFLFNHRLAKLSQKNSPNYSLKIIRTSGTEAPDTIELETRLLVLAIGHSARDTFRMLFASDFEMQAKSFAVGVRTEHPQSWIDQAMYGEKCPYEMQPAPYKLTHKCRDGRGVYSFCMCPGGYVVNASSEEGRLAVNGMSYHDRDSTNANSAIVVTVSPEDFGGETPLDGLEFQRRLEEAAYRIGNGKIPVQRYEDFKKNRSSEEPGTVHPQMKGQYQPANVRAIFPDFICRDIEEGMESFERRIPGFSHPDALLFGVESRTSSPVRLVRDDQCECSFSGIYPCGEGAGYAGGITSAAMDGIRVAECIARKFSIDFLVK